MVPLENRRHLSDFGELLKSITLSTRDHNEKQLNSVPRRSKYLSCDLSKHHVVLEIHEDVSTVNSYQRLLKFLSHFISRVLSPRGLIKHSMRI